MFALRLRKAHFPIGGLVLSLLLLAILVQIIYSSHHFFNHSASFSKTSKHFRPRDKGDSLPPRQQASTFSESVGMTNHKSQQITEAQDVNKKRYREFIIRLIKITRQIYSDQNRATRDDVEVPLKVVPKRFCKRSPMNTTSSLGLLVIMVTSSPKQVEVRHAIRRSWANVSEVDSGRVRVVFLIGADNDVAVRSEAAEFDDMVQGDFEDDYENLTSKTIMALKWATMWCQDRFKFVMKTDSDVYVNVPKLARHLDSVDDWEKPRAFGRLWVGARPIRSPVLKWYVFAATLLFIKI